MMWEVLDRGYLNPSGFMCFPTTYIHNLPTLFSDHISMVLCPKGDQLRRRKWGYRLEAWAFQAKDVCQHLQFVWANASVVGSTMFILISKLKQIQFVCRQWCTEWKRKRHAPIKDSLNKLKVLQQDLQSRGLRTLSFSIVFPSTGNL